MLLQMLLLRRRPNKETIIKQMKKEDEGSSSFFVSHFLGYVFATAVIRQPYRPARGTTPTQRVVGLSHWGSRHNLGQPHITAKKTAHPTDALLFAVET